MRVKIYQCDFVSPSWLSRSAISLSNDVDSLLAFAMEPSFERAFAIASAVNITGFLFIQLALTVAWLSEVANESPFAKEFDRELASKIFIGFWFKSANVLIVGKLTE